MVRFPLFFVLQKVDFMLRPFRCLNYEPIFLKTVLNAPFFAQQRPLKHNLANGCSSTHILLDCNHAGRVQRFL
jgi:hypothetical protein